MTPGDDLLPTAPRPIARRSATPPPPVPAKWSRRRGVTGFLAALAVVAFAGAYIGPLGGALPRARADEVVPVSLYADSLHDAQRFIASETAGEQPGLDRDGYTVYVTPKPTPTPAPVAAVGAASGTGWTPPFVSPDPGSAQAIAYDMVRARGWGDDHFSCLVALWHKESGWRVNAYNRSSGAYGIPQSLPGGKMASAGADWETNPATQIAWGLGYIGARYGAPCGAWAHSQAKGWY